MTRPGEHTGLLPSPSDPDHRFGFATLGCPGAPLDEVIATARRHGCAAVELRAAENEAVHTGLPATRLDRVRRDLASAGLLPLAVSTYVRLCVPRAGAGTADAQLDGLLAHLDLAGLVGAVAVRVFMNDPDTPAGRPDPPGGGRPGPTAPTSGERRALERLGRAVRHAAEAGVTILIETHDSRARADRMSRFLTWLDAEVPGHGCGVVWDTAHTWAHGEEPADSFALLAPWLGYLQVKDVRSAADPVPVALGAGSYPIGGLATALQPAGFAGWVSLEWERR